LKTQEIIHDEGMKKELEHLAGEAGQPKTYTFGAAGAMVASLNFRFEK
jgi:hypothetical protein